MDFSPHLRTIFATRGSSAIYAPPLGPQISCKAIRQGGGQPVRIGPVLVTTERISFHVRRAEITAPVAGATLAYRAETFTIDAVQPVERDAEGLLWSLDASWGAAMIYRSVSGSGATQNPPQGAEFSVAVGAPAGATAISIKSGFAVGKLLAGDKIVVGAHTYVIAGAGVQAVANQFPAVPISPPLAAAATAGDAASLIFGRDLPVRGAVAGYAANELLGGVQTGDRRIVIMQEALAPLGTTPKTGDKIILEGRPFNVQSAAAIYQGTSPVAWDIQVRG